VAHSTRSTRYPGWASKGKPSRGCGRGFTPSPAFHSSNDELASYCLLVWDLTSELCQNVPAEATQAFEACDQSQNCFRDQNNATRWISPSACLASCGGFTEELRQKPWCGEYKANDHRTTKCWDTQNIYEYPIPTHISDQ
jgi:hypothetical protein